MKCRRRAPGTTGTPIIRSHKAILAGWHPPQGSDDLPVCEATIINSPESHPEVKRINATHGMMHTLAGHPGVVRFGASVAVWWPDGPGGKAGHVVHDIQDFYKHYEVF